MKKQYSTLIVIGAIALVLIIFLSNQIFITLKPGEKGVIFRKFTTGLDKENIYDAGFYVIAPWNEMYVYDVKEQKIEETMDVLDKNGLSVNVDVSVRFRPIYDKIGDLHENFGVKYINQLVVPEVRSSVRQVMGNYTAEEIYSTKRPQVEKQIIEVTRKVLASPENNIKMTTLLIRSINLPSEIKEAIESKLKQEQESLAYEYKLEKEEKERQRKIISAKADSASNAIVNSSLTDKLLKLRGIEATIKVSQSENSKVIVIGSGEDGLPLILGNQ